MRERSRKFGRALLVCAAALGSVHPSAPAPAQVSLGDPKIGLTPLALNSLLGRYRWPVVCAQPGGDSRLVEEGIAFRSAKQLYKGQMAVKVTFFGIDASGASVCFNRSDPSIPNRRGVLYLTFPSHGRRDLGVSEFRRLMERGEARYPIVGGRLVLREIGKPDDAPREISFNEEAGTLVVRNVDRGTPGEKLIARYLTAHGRERRIPRALSFEWIMPQGESFRTVMAEDPSRWR